VSAVWALLGNARLQVHSSVSVPYMLSHDRLNDPASAAEAAELFTPLRSFDLVSVA
jgi:hypothetical protein